MRDEILVHIGTGHRRHAPGKLLRLCLRLRRVQRRHGALVADGARQVVFLEYGYVDQDHNWSGTASAPAAGNDDKRLSTAFYTLGAQFSPDADWNVGVTMPYLDRSLTASDGGTMQTVHHDGIGDARVSVKYTGFSADRSSGIEAGLKLPTGAYDTHGFDRDTDLGTGTTDVLLGAYHLANFGGEAQWTGFARAQLSYALAERAGYRPGNEADAILGVSYAGWSFGRRSTLAPGLEWDSGKLKLYADVEFALYQDVIGDQLVAEHQYKAVVSYRL